MKDFQLLIYNTPTEDVKIDVVLVDETIWATQKAMSTLFDCTVQNISYHLGKVFKSGELERSAARYEQPECAVVEVIIKNTVLIVSTEKGDVVDRSDELWWD